MLTYRVKCGSAMVIEQHQQRQMRIDLKDIILLFEKIQEDMNISYVSIVVFCAVDVDSLCTLKIFSKLFKSQNIQYKVYPVTRYTQLLARIEQSRVYEQVKLFLFVNCGGIIDLTQSDIMQRNDAQIFLFDINKPINHKNLESQYIKVIDDGYSEFDNCPTSLEIQKCEEINQYVLDSDEAEEEEEEEPDDSPKRKNQKVFRDKLRKHREVIQNKVESYYNRNFFGYPSSFSAYRMVRDLKKANNDYLWYAIVGMTSMYLDHKITKEVLDFLSQTYKLDMLRFNPQSQKKEKGEISSKKGYQFTLMDHWSLYESMMNSNYLMTKLHLWEDQGKKRLHEFIHTIGISLNEAKQLYKYMSQDSQRKLENSIFPSAEKFGLHEVAYMSFMRHVDYTASFMASDFCHILTSVLEAPPLIDTSYNDLHDFRIRSFWQAYDVFDGSIKDLNAKIENYKRMVKILMTETRNIMERDHLIIGNSVSIASIKNDTADRKIFQHPSALIRIANLLMQISIQRKKAKSNRPLVAVWIDLQKEVCQVVGVMMDSKNSTGSKFNKIAQNLKIEVDHDNFMASIMTIHKDHLSEFIKEISKA